VSLSLSAGYLQGLNVCRGLLTFSCLFFISVNDVYATSDKLEAAGVTFKKKPDEGKFSRRFAY
jgi:hypothetical protein